MVVLLKTASTQVSFIQIMQIRVQNKSKSVRKSRYVGDVSEHEEEGLLKVLKKHRAAIGYTLDDLKGISPTLCQHKINMEPNAKPVIIINDD